MIAALLAAITIFSILGYVTIPSEEDLVQTTQTHADNLTRIRAMNAMINRGYWDDKTFKDFERFLKSGPYSTRQFIADMHGDLLKPENRQMWKK